MGNVPARKRLPDVGECAGKRHRSSGLFRTQHAIGKVGLSSIRDTLGRRIPLEHDPRTLHQWKRVQQYLHFIDEVPGNCLPRLPRAKQQLQFREALGQ
ncbi:hypothetical protein D3C71_1606160 [compost metagenome]